MVTAWRRPKAKVNNLNNAPLEPQETWTTHELTRPFPAPFPYDIVDMIIAYLTRHRDTLEACSLTCHSWYTAAAPHLHHTLTLTGDGPRSQLVPLSNLHELGLMPLVREIQVKQRRPWFAPQAFSHLDLYYFSSLTNVHTLKLENVEIFRFISLVDRYFQHFAPTLRSITLSDPWCTPRQLSHFLSLFSNLDDIEIRNAHLTTIPDKVLAPFSAPKLRGRLALYNASSVETWTHLITSSGGLRFRHMDLHKVGSCAPVLLEACAETLETLRLGARDDSLSE